MAEQKQQTESSSLSKPIYKRRWFKWILATYIVLLIFFTLLPVGIRYAAVHLLKDQGIQQVEIRDVDLNLFSGEFGLSDVNISGDGQGRASLSHLYLNIAMLELLKKRAVIEQVEITGIDVDVQNTEAGDWIVAGILPPSPAATEETQQPKKSSEPWGIGINQLKLGGISVRLAMPQLETKLRLNDLQLSQLASWQSEQAAHYQLRLRIDDAPLELTGQIHAFKQVPEFKGTLKLEQLPLAMASEFVKEAGVEEMQGLLAVATDFDVRLEKRQPVVASKTNINLTDVYVKHGQYQVQAVQMGWHGQVDYLVPASEQDLGARANGKLSLNNFKLNDAQANMTLAAFEQLNINKLELTEAQQLTIKAMVLEQLSLLQNDKDERLAQLVGITTTDIAFDGKQSLEIEDITINGLDAKFKIKPDGTIYLLDDLTANAAAQKEMPAEVPTEESTEENLEKNESAAFNFKLARLNLGDDSQIIFHDESVTPAYLAEIKPISLTVSDIDTSLVDQDIAIELQGIINKNEKLNLSATLRPFGEKLNMSAETKISSLELHPLSPYLNNQIGYYIKRGQLNADVNGVIVNDQLDYKVSVMLNKFVVEKGDPAKAKSYSEKLSMPLNTSLELLRDKNDNIKLEVPISGDINAPQFDISQVINKAIANATTAAVTGYLAFMLQPWGVALLAADMLRGDGSVSMDPVEFAPAQVALSDDYADYLTKVAELLQERDNIELKICALTSEQDRQALITAQQSEAKPASVEKEKEQMSAAEPDAIEIGNDQLLELALERSKYVKAFLIEKGVDAGRLFTCQPIIDDLDKNLPQVELSL